MTNSLVQKGNSVICLKKAALLFVKHLFCGVSARGPFSHLAFNYIYQRRLELCSQCLTLYTQREKLDIVAYNYCISCSFKSLPSSHSLLKVNLEGNGDLLCAFNLPSFSLLLSETCKQNLSQIVSMKHFLHLVIVKLPLFTLISSSHSFFRRGAENRSPLSFSVHYI